MSSEDKGKRDRYWSVMLVGDHGRVIPFRHFKGLAITLCVGFILMLIAIIVMAILYTHQMKKLTTLHSRLTEVQQQNSKLRDEKDLYLTRLMLKENKRTFKSEKPASTKPAEAPAPDPVKVKKEIKEPQKPAPKPKKPAPVVKQPIKNKWMADIRNFSVSYDARQEMLKAQFRIYNTSKPKNPLSGRSVIVFKVVDEPSIKWLTVPQVQLQDGKPPADKGQPFQIRNYFTMRFRAYRQKAPIQYNAATAYVYSSEGKLLASKDLAFKIKAPPLEKKEAPKPEPVVDKKPEAPLQEAIESSTDTPKKELPPSAAPTEEGGDTGTGTALPKIDTPPTPTQPTTEKETAPAGQTPETPAGEASEDSSPIDSPATGTDKEPLTTPNSPETVPKP